MSASISTVGASLRGLTVDGVEIVPSYPIDMPTPSCSGVVLVPWPNRIRDGRWGDQQLAITEPAKNNASHGLLRYSNYQQTERSSSSVTLSADVHPQLGYPFWLRTHVTYTLCPDGISITHEVTNLGDEPAPFGIGAHPYLTFNDDAAPDGRTISLKQGEGLDYVQVFTKPDYPNTDGTVSAIAVEPQSCAANAFNSGDGLRHLAASETSSFDWIITLTR